MHECEKTHGVYQHTTQQQQQQQRQQQQQLCLIYLWHTPQLGQHVSTTTTRINGITYIIIFIYINMYSHSFTYIYNIYHINKVKYAKKLFRMLRLKSECTKQNSENGRTGPSSLERSSARLSELNWRNYRSGSLGARLSELKWRRYRSCSLGARLSELAITKSGQKQGRSLERRGVRLSEASSGSSKSSRNF